MKEALWIGVPALCVLGADHLWGGVAALKVALGLILCLLALMAVQR
jgi:hypothetical protein